MTGRRPARKRAGSGKRAAAGGTILAAGIIKYADAPLAVSAREKSGDGAGRTAGRGPYPCRVRRG